MTTLDVRRATKLVRRHLPTKAVPAVVRMRARRAMADPAVLAGARQQMGFLLGAALPQADMEAAARRYVEWMTWRGEARLHAELVFRPQRLENVELLTERAGGVVLSFIHHGQYDGTCASLNAIGVRTQAMVLASSLQPDAPPHVQQHVQVVSQYSDVFSTEEGLPGIVGRVVDGQVVLVASDMRGSSEVEFVGRKLRGASGAVRVAYQTGCPVVVATAHRDPTGDQFQPFVRFHLRRPEDFSDPRALLAELMRLHTAAVLEWPEAYETPLNYWGVTADELAGAQPENG